MRWSPDEHVATDAFKEESAASGFSRRPTDYASRFAGSHLLGSFGLRLVCGVFQKLERRVVDKRVKGCEIVGRLNRQAFDSAWTSIVSMASVQPATKPVDRFAVSVNLAGNLSRVSTCANNPYPTPVSGRGCYLCWRMTCLIRTQYGFSGVKKSIESKHSRALLRRCDKENAAHAACDVCQPRSTYIVT